MIRQMLTSAYMLNYQILMVLLPQTCYSIGEHMICKLHPWEETTASGEEVHLVQRTAWISSTI